MQWILVWVGLAFPLSAAAQGSFKANGLIWSPPSGKNMTFDAAEAYCDSMPQTDSGFDRWRLPSPVEIAKLRSANASQFAGTTLDNYFWTSAKGPGGAVIASPTLNESYEAKGPFTSVICAASAILKQAVKNETPVINQNL